jgi:hypothetical protein
MYAPFTSNVVSNGKTRKFYHKGLACQTLNLGKSTHQATFYYAFLLNIQVIKVLISENASERVIFYRKYQISPVQRPQNRVRIGTRRMESWEIIHQNLSASK